MIKHFFTAVSMALLLPAFQFARAQVFSSDDITATVQYTGSHDSTMCTTYATEALGLTIENSFMGDTCKVKSMWGDQWGEAVNTTGQNPWNVTIPLFSMQAPDYQDYGLDSVSFMLNALYKVTTLHDTLENILMEFWIPRPDACSYIEQLGNVFLDNDANCQIGFGDNGLHNIPVDIQVQVSSPPAQIDMELHTNFGTFWNYVQESWMTSYTVSIPTWLQFIFPVSSCSAASQTYTSYPGDIVFALECTSNLDVSTSIGSSGVVRPNIPFLLHPSVNNTGCTAATGVLKLVLDPNVVYDPLLSNNPATSVVGDTLFWDYSNLNSISGGGYWNSFLSGIHLTPTLAVNIGDSLCFTLITDTLVADVDPANNVTTLCLPVVNSYDPNMKEVTPAGTGTIGAIPPETEKLLYTIHFQNTGNAEAYNISVLDTLDAALDPSTLHILSTSHNMVPEWVSETVVRFNFPNIYLADSVSNEPESHGFVTFEIALDDNLPLGTEIENTGYIYFDFNEAIVTNTTLNTLSVLAGIAENSKVALNIFPNPASGTVTIEAEAISLVTLVDFSGKTILSTTALTDSQLDISGIGNGIYLLHVETARGTAVRKLAIAH